MQPLYLMNWLSWPRYLPKVVRDCVAYDSSHQKTERPTESYEVQLPSRFLKRLQMVCIEFRKECVSVTRENTEESAVQLCTEYWMRKRSTRWRGLNKSWFVRRYWHNHTSRGDWRWTRMFAPLILDVYYCTYNLIIRKSQLRTRPSPIPVLSAYTTGPDGDISWYSGQYCYHDRTLRVRVSQLARSTTHLNGEWIFRVTQEDSYDAVYSYPNWTLV